MDTNDPVEANPESIAAMTALAHRYFLHRLYDDAACLFDVILRHRPAQADLHYAHAKALHALGRHDEALQAYSRALVLGVTDPALHLYMGQCLIYRRHFEGARRSLEECLRMAQLQHLQRPAVTEPAQHLLDRVVDLLKKYSIRTAPATTTAALRGPMETTV